MDLDLDIGNTDWCTLGYTILPTLYYIALTVLRYPYSVLAFFLDGFESLQFQLCHNTLHIHRSYYL
jgi:hypothetical protein